MMKRCKTQSCSNLTNQGNNFEVIPFDLVIEILLRLPAKSIAKFRCVSKLWNSTIRSPSFTKSFLPISSSRPKLMIVSQKGDRTFFFSAPQPQNPSSLLTVTSHMSFPVNYPSGNCRPIRGLVCGLHQKKFKGRRVTVPVICNPSTGQSLSLPRVKTRRTQVFSYLGYDPIDQQFKVLCMTESRYGPYTSQGHQILTLDFGKKRPSWRMIKCDIPHTAYLNGRDVYDGLCINGVLYYLAKVQNRTTTDIVCFDIKSEKFAWIRQDQDMRNGYSYESVLVDYKGKLAMLRPYYGNQRSIQINKLAMLQPYYGNQRSIQINIKLWVLEDAAKNQWLSYNYIYNISSPRLSIWTKENSFRYVGTAETGEIVLSPKYIKDSYYLVYLNTEKKTITEVNILGMEGFKDQDVYAFLDHVENLTLLTSVSV